MKAQAKRGRGRPKGGPVAKVNVEVRPDLREKIDAMKAERKWSLRTTVETILDVYFEKHAGK